MSILGSGRASSRPGKGGGRNRQEQTPGAAPGEPQERRLERGEQAAGLAASQLELEQNLEAWGLESTYRGMYWGWQGRLGKKQGPRLENLHC